MTSPLAATLKLPSGARVPRFGLGTWRMGESKAGRAEEVRSLQRGLDRGIRLIDTAEMYGEGGAEEVIAEALGNRRDEVFLVSKVYPHNAGRKAAIAACERSLKRLKTERIDLYLLHWRGRVPLTETVEAFERLKQDGKIGDWGVSNFDVDDMADLERAGGQACGANQILYNLSRRACEWQLLDICRQRDVPVMAYSPVEQGRLLGDRKLWAFAKARGLSAAQVCLAWLLDKPNVCVIPKAVREAHLEDDLGALDVKLSDQDRAALDAIFPPPRKAAPLDML